MSEAISVETAGVITESLRELAWGQISLMEFVGQLAACGVYRYHADFARHELTFYTNSGPSLALSTAGPLFTVGEEFSPNQLQDAFQEAWRTEQAFSRLQETAMNAGCNGYFLQFAPLRVLVYGLRTDWQMLDVIGIDF